MTNEPSIGLKSSMLGIYRTELLSDPEFFSNKKAAPGLKKLAFGLVMFHAVLL